MAHIRPFRALRYDADVVGDLRKVVSPPYDVISREEQALLHLSSPYNATHLDFNNAADPYGAAASTFRRWLEDGVVKLDETPGYYYYRQEFELKDGSRRTRSGIFVALRVEDFETGTIRPHEQTFPGAKKDRLALLRACQTHLSSIFCLYGKKDWSVADVIPELLELPASVQLTDRDRVTHRLWYVTEASAIETITKEIAAQSLIIADGHHRYETALQYSVERSAAGAPSDSDQPYNYVLAYLTNAEENGLAILPTHRVLKKNSLPNVADLEKVLLRDFRLKRYAREENKAFDMALLTEGIDRRIGCVLSGTGCHWLLTFDERLARRLNASDPVRALDVTVLHDYIFERLLGLTPQMQREKITYVSDDEAAVRAVDEGEADAAFLLNATTFEQIRAVCSSGETMRQKSTYFYPKLPTGLVFYPLHDE